MATKTSMHDGHRQRMRQRVAKNGLSSLQAHEVLEYLLYSFVPRKDTNPVAHALIKTFGSLAGVFNAAKEDLQKVSGVTENAALFLSSVPELCRLYLEGQMASDGQLVLSGRGAAREFMGNKLFGMREETAFVAAIDVHDKLICCEKMGIGSANAIALSVRQVAEFALRHHASAVLIAHNHPGGNVLPSQADVEFTFEVLDTLSNLGVVLQDHFIFCGGEYFSFEESGKLLSMKNVKTNLREGINYYD